MGRFVKPRIVHGDPSYLSSPSPVPSQLTKLIKTISVDSENTFSSVFGYSTNEYI